MSNKRTERRSLRIRDWTSEEVNLADMAAGRMYLHSVGELKMDPRTQTDEIVTDTMKWANAEYDGDFASVAGSLERFLRNQLAAIVENRFVTLSGTTPDNGVLEQYMEAVRSNALKGTSRVLDKLQTYAREREFSRERTMQEAAFLQSLAIAIVYCRRQEQN